MRVKFLKLDVLTTQNYSFLIEGENKSKLLILYFRLVEFLHVKMLDEPGLMAVIEQPWWDCHGTDKEVEERKKPYLKSCNRIFEAVLSNFVFFFYFEVGFNV